MQVTMADANVPIGSSQWFQFTVKPTPHLPFDALVAADADDHVNVITSPTESWIPEFPVITHREITAYADGLWGPQEYTRWPQIFSESIFHHACIPLKGTLDAPADSVYDGFGSSFFTDTALNFNDMYDCETPGFGRMTTEVLTELSGQAELAIENSLTCHIACVL
ncbi:hypothetical protein EVJ58_g3369 [Rhodofomes roseus]|uniref:Uncharacterized protein n=1 Tax=Rhodofomes roseus TaxID=34475 RepID=A0A4Y9YQ96_9APHY|nr:hypothetical protein EVJ58_g3369 [Rhodofomes roseus]